MNTGFSTSEPDEKKQQYFLSGNAISLTYEEPKKYIISCFDVSESGLVAVGSATYGNQYIYVYDATGKFQYGYAFNNPGSYGLQWDGSDWNYFVSSVINRPRKLVPDIDAQPTTIGKNTIAFFPY